MSWLTLSSGLVLTLVKVLCGLVQMIKIIVIGNYQPNNFEQANNTFQKNKNKKKLYEIIQYFCVSVIMAPSGQLLVINFVERFPGYINHGNT